MSSRAHVAWFIVVAGLACWAWHDVGSLGLVYEDLRWTDGAERIRDWTLTLRGRPLSLGVWHLTREWPVGQQHLIAPMVHVVNAGLVWVLACRLGLSAGGAWLSSAVFLLHPIQSQAVAYLSARADVMAATGVLVALLLATSPAWWLVPLAILAAVMCKEASVIGVALVPLMRRQWGVALIALVAVVGYAGWFSASVLMAPPSLAWALWQMVAGGRLLTQMAWPHALTVDFDYAALSGVEMWAHGLLVMAMAGLAWGLRRVWPVVAIGLAIPIAVIALRLVIVTPTSLINEGQMYLGSVGVALAVGALSDRLWRVA